MEMLDGGVWDLYIDLANICDHVLPLCEAFVQTLDTEKLLKAIRKVPGPVSYTHLRAHQTLR